MKTDHYTYRVTWSVEDGEHVGLCAEFPSLSWLAATPEEALAGVRKMVADGQKSTTAVSFGFASHPRFIAHSPSRRRNSA